uniref:KIAA0825 n=1 Tax=Poecilia mexicana TaxID=48701 RepID=A0A3B3X923_9TELE
MEWPGEFPEDHAFVELLIPGVSSDVDFKQFLKDTEEKLSLNASSIEQHLKELQAKMGDSRTGDRPPSPTEVLQWFNTRAQNSLKPLSTDILDFFRALQQYLKSEEEGKEEVTLQLLLDVSAQCGVYFPCPSSSSSLHPHLPGSSVDSVHTVKDDSAVEIQEAWDPVRLQLRRFLMDRLSCCTSGPPGSPQLSTMTILERVNCFKQLFFLYPECEVVTGYQGLKQKYVLSILHSSMSSSPGGESGFDRLTTGFCNVVQHVTQALTEELQVLSRVVEPEVVLGFLNVAYFGAIAQEMTSQMEREFETAQRDNTALSGKTKKYSVMSRATVDVGFRSGRSRSSS